MQLHILSLLHSTESFVQERIAKGVQKARKIINSELESNDDLADRLKYIISQYYKIPYFSEMFDELTLDDLILEMMLITESNKEQDERTSDVVKENMDEVNDLFEELDVPEDNGEEAFRNEFGQKFMEKGFEGVV